MLPNLRLERQIKRGQMGKIRIFITESAIKDYKHQCEKKLIEFCEKELKWEDVKISLELEEDNG